MNVYVVIYGCVDLGETINSVHATAELAKTHAQECAEEQASSLTEMDGDKFIAVEDEDGDFSVVREEDELSIPVEWYHIEEHPVLIT
jgi:hypothetical protein